MGSKDLDQKITDFIQRKELEFPELSHMGYAHRHSRLSAHRHVKW